MSIGPMDIADAHGEGEQAAYQGQDFWMNPYTSMTDAIMRTQAWFTGWCYGRRRIEMGEV